MEQQPFLFSEAEMRTFGRPIPPSQPELTLDAAALQHWKGKIATFQAQVRQQQAPEQMGLWQQPQESSPLQTQDKIILDPFQLDLQNFFFFQWPMDRNPSDPCLYFVLDTTAELLLYIGETCQVNQRWAGYHDCKRYVLNYQSAHFQLRTRTTINIGFWWDTPLATRPRQRLESHLIKTWRAPFNQENWAFWATPFVYRVENDPG